MLITTLILLHCNVWSCIVLHWLGLMDVIVEEEQHLLQGMRSPLGRTDARKRDIARAAHPHEPDGRQGVRVLKMQCVMIQSILCRYSLSEAHVALCHPCRPIRVFKLGSLLDGYVTVPSLGYDHSGLERRNACSSAAPGPHARVLIDDMITTECCCCFLGIGGNLAT